VKPRAPSASPTGQKGWLLSGRLAAWVGDSVTSEWNSTSQFLGGNLGVTWES